MNARMEPLIAAALVIFSTASHRVGHAAPVSSPDSLPSHSAGATKPPEWPRHVLRAEQTWQLNLPGGERFDASALVLTPKGDLLTLSDRGLTIYRIRFLAGTNSADLIPLPECFTTNQLAPLNRNKVGRYDCEGLAQDEQGRVYVCEESNRWILRFDPNRGKVERLEIDWSPVRKYFSRFDRNASFEGVAVGGGKLYVANERSRGRIIVVDLKSLRVADDFLANPSGNNARDVDYSDLSWFDGTLFALLRESRCVLAIDPLRKRVIAQYDYREMEQQPEVIYYTLFPTGTMEGLAVDRDFIWLVTDNNGLPRVRHRHDIRPTLFKCRRPDAHAEKRGASQSSVVRGQ